MMVSGREDFLTTLLNCGILDLKLIDDVGYDWYDIIDEEALSVVFSKVGGRRNTLNSLMRRVVEFGVEQIAVAVADRICELEAIPNERELDKEEEAELAELRMLDPWEDIESFHNYIDTHIWFEKNEEAYRTYLPKAISEFADGTGLEIEERWG